MFSFGVEFFRSNDSLFFPLSQQKYAKEVVEHFCVCKGKTLKSPMDPNVKFSPAYFPEEVNSKLQKEYLSKVGSLQYLAVWTRPDLSYTVAISSRF